MAATATNPCVPSASGISGAWWSEDDACEHPAGEPTHRHAHEHPHDQVRPEPLRGPLLPGGGCRGHRHGGEDERIGQTVVEARFTRERESNLVLVADGLTVHGRLADVDVGRQHGVGRRHHRPEQQRGGGGQPRQPTCDEDREDRDGHGDAEQTPGARPAPPARLAVDGQAGAEQRDQHGEFGDVLGHLEMLTEVDVTERRDDTEHDGADHDQHHRQRQRPITKELRQQRCEEDDDPDGDRRQGVAVQPAPPGRGSVAASAGASPLATWRQFRVGSRSQNRNAVHAWRKDVAEAGFASSVT